MIIHPLMLGNHHQYFKDGILIELTHKSKPSNVLAAGGRYEHYFQSTTYEILTWCPDTTQ
jgi:hypothetical protein